jgi:murein DD-endopeptidase MepM/ murein hydrolase activator NlpD
MRFGTNFGIREMKRMENAMIRYRYASKRRHASRRRGKIPGQGGGRLRRLIVLQAMACSVLFLIIMAARSVNITAANFITGQVRHVLQHDIELKSALSSTKRFIDDIRDKVVPDRASDKLTSPGGVHASDEAGAEASEPDTASISDKGEPGNAKVPFEGDKPPDTDTGYAGEAGGTTALPETSVLSANSESGTERIQDMIEPVEGTLATPFGETRDAVTGSVRMHTGIDIDTKPGSDVKAVLDGEVTGTGSSPEYGGYVEIQHYNGLRTVYANCGEIAVNGGEIVKRGDIIARTCNSGILTGSHLHFEIRDGEYAVDPLEYISVPGK